MNGSCRWTLRFGALVLCAALAIAPALGAERAPKSTLRVFAAASLVDAFRDIASAFERAHPGTKVQLNLAGSQQLAAQIEQGASADVFASADQRWMDYLKERERLDGDAVVFAHNRLVVVVPRTNPGRVSRLEDLARPGVKLVIGAEAVPVGAYTRQAIRRLADRDGFPDRYADRVLANVVSEEENVRSVVGKVQLGEADAGVCYQSDVTPSVARYVRVFEIPSDANVTATYPIAVVVHSSRAELARAFVADVLSPDGQRTLQHWKLLPAATPQ